VERPSKYHTSSFIGKGIKGANENGYSYHWDSAHPELEPTSTFNLGCSHYCSYCCKPAYPIQEGLRRDLYVFVDFYDRDFTVTGHTCICEGAEKEKELRKKLEEMEKKHKQEKYELEKEYKDVLKHDKRGRLELKHKKELKDLEWNEDCFRFE